MGERKAPEPLRSLSQEELVRTRRETLGHYDRRAQAFWQGTKDHDVSQNIEALLRHLPKEPGLELLDLGCGPGRDLIELSRRGHRPTGLDGAAAFVEMARAQSGCDVWHQDFLELDLPSERFDGIFANAVLFHVPSQELSRVLSELYASLKPAGVLFCSNPHGPDIERQNGDRYGCFLTPETWSAYATGAGFTLLEQYFRPAGRPREEQPWLATVWRKRA